jgi:pyridoxine 4-dehydrogenase
MQLTWTPHPPPESQAFDAMKAALDAGATTWSTATFYGPPGHEFDNLALIGRFFKAYPEYIGRVQLVVKGGIAAEGGALVPTNE